MRIWQSDDRLTLRIEKLKKICLDEQIGDLPPMFLFFNLKILSYMYIRENTLYFILFKIAQSRITFKKFDFLIFQAMNSS